MNMQKKLFKNIDPVKNARSLNFSTSMFKILFYSQMLHFYVFQVPVKCRYEKQLKK